jgi:hypothetical protein
MTPQQMAREYVDTLNSPANGWGQHISRKLGIVSHAVMSRLAGMVGNDEAQRLISEAFKHDQ